MKHLAALSTILLFVASIYSQDTTKDDSLAALRTMRINIRNATADGQDTRWIADDYQLLSTMVRNVEDGNADASNERILGVYREKRDATGKEDYAAYLAAMWYELRVGRTAIPEQKALDAITLAAASTRLIPVKISTKPDRARFAFAGANRVAGETNCEWWVFPGRRQIFVSRDGYMNVDEEVEFTKDKREYSRELSPK